ncbi:unnamed protein product [Effrenium voratum]|nr:unnamed protein product [Effrenium voratum]
MALCTFAIPVKDVSGRLGLLSGCFLAVLAYRYIVNEILPRKSYLTAADMYISFACLFQIGICAQTVVFGILRNREDGHKNADELNKRDNILGSLMALAWLAINIFLWCLWRLDMRQSWSSVYEDNKEPYAPVRECTRCKEGWLSLMCTHGDKDSACKDCGAPVKRHYLTPQARLPLVSVSVYVYVVVCCLLVCFFAVVFVCFVCLGLSCFFLI